MTHHAMLCLQVCAASTAANTSISRNADFICTDQAADGVRTRTTAACRVSSKLAICCLSSGCQEGAEALQIA